MAELVERSLATTAETGRPLRIPFARQFHRVADLVCGIAPLVRSARSLSFAQYGEDVLLAVCLFPRSKGFYVDVGAYHPWRNSNTYKLYLRGWSGLTIEPNPAAERLFRRYRSRDRHVVAGIAEKTERLPYWRFRDGKLNTFSADVAATYANRGDDSLAQATVPCKPLQAIIDELAPSVNIDLLSVDCEGFDLVVLRTLDFSRTRPTAILVEDFEAFESRKAGGKASAIETLLRDADYAPISQAVYSTLYLDTRALRAAHQTVFDFSAMDPMKSTRQVPRV